MTRYRVHGYVNGYPVDVEVDADTAADAINIVGDRFCPKFTKQPRTQRKQWFIDHVRLNAVQIATNPPKN